MKVAVIGTGYVGLVTGTCFADMGNDVWCADVDEKKIKGLNKNIIPIYEPGLEELVLSNREDGRLKFTNSLAEAIKEAQFVFIAVGTPPGEDGSADLSHVLSVAREIGMNMDHYMLIVNKSTVPVGTAEKVRAVIRQSLDERGAGNLDFDMVSNPEFLKEGDAIEDFMSPDRVVVGVDSERAADLIKELYSSFSRKGNKLVIMDIVSAELTKYAANAMLATRISFMNELSHICEAAGADIEHIRNGIGSDSRIGKSFLYAGIGYGGSCFPKDVRALLKTSNELGLPGKILKAVEEINIYQRRHFVEKITAVMGSDLRGVIFSVWGLSFKPRTDDMREAPSVDIINSLRDMGASFRAYDPVATETAAARLGKERITYCDKYYDALNGSDALLILTEWHHFRKPDYERIKSLMKSPIIFDGRNQYEPEKMKKMGFRYYCVGRP